METTIGYLVDTNIWLERLLDQDKSEIVSKFFNLIPTNQLYASDFGIHSIGVILTRLNKLIVFEKFIRDVFLNAQIEMLSLKATDLLSVINNMQEFKLDFDDSYQFTISLKHDLTIVTFDKDFNAKGIKKNSPEEVIKLELER